MRTKTRFSWRAFTSLYITLSLIIMIVSGIVLYIAPPGRIAKWTSIPIMGLEKEQWQALHTIFTFLFIIANGFHLYFNWKPFISYLSERRKRFFRIRKELLSAFVVTSGIFYMVFVNAQPFKAVTDFGEYMKDGWSIDSLEPPVPHAEEMTISELAKTINRDPQELISSLDKQGISADLNSVIRDIAQKYDLSPQMVFEKMQLQQESKTIHEGAKGGYGRMTVFQICNEKNISFNDALARLKTVGIEANAEITLRELGQNYQKTPLEIVNIIETSVKNE